mmetsp:Transcript_3424/g.5073  ORF Transcript_3424/g.5073 Transcript_3424/m.5073 type:complete len:323 (-) Transcript_3424:92-1060(-)
MPVAQLIYRVITVYYFVLLFQTSTAFAQVTEGNSNHRHPRQSDPAVVTNSTTNGESASASASPKYYLILLYIVVCGIFGCFMASFIECYRTLKRESMGLSPDEQREVDRIREQRIMVVAKKNRREILESILHCQTLEEVKKTTANLTVSEGVEKPPSLEMPPVNRPRSPSFQEESSDCLSDQDVECGAISNNRYEIKSPLQSKTSTLDLRGAYSPLAVRDDQKIEVAHEIVNEEYVKRSTTCTEANSECAICLCAYDDDDTVMFSKYCTHCFHKECILEWLQNNDVCPCCRCPTVTTMEVNSVASHILGKTTVSEAMKLYNR